MVVARLGNTLSATLRRSVLGSLVAFACATSWLTGCSSSTGGRSPNTQATAPTTSTSRDAVTNSVPQRVACFGAAALAAPTGVCKPTTSGKLTPPADRAAKDESDAYSGDGKHSDCFSHPPAFPLVECSFGDKSSKVDVALVGNSHAGQWVPAMEQVAKSEHWHLITYLASQCASADVGQNLPGAAAAGCSKWVHNATQKLTAKHFDLVVMTNRVSVSATGANGSQAKNAQLYQRGYAAVLRQLVAAAEPVVVIHDTPSPSSLIPDCLQQHSNDYSACGGSRSKWVAPDPAIGAVSSVAKSTVTSIDLTDRICTATSCPAAVGGVPVYKDASHLTATYDATLTPYLRPALVAAIAHK